MDNSLTNPFPISGSMAMPFVSVELREDQAWVALDRPPRNSINPVLANSLQRALLAARDDDQVEAIVLTGSDTCFAAGADIPFFVRQLKAGELDRIERFSAQLHQVCNSLADLGKPVVAVVHGSALGAGLELALACGRVIASRNATLGLPETGLGICPGSGGTQRVPRRIGVGLAKWLIYSGHLLSGHDAAELGLIDVCVHDRDLKAAILGQIQELAGDNALPPARPATPASYQSLEKTFDRYTVSQLLDPSRPQSLLSTEDARCRRAVERLRTRSANALMLAERLIDQGGDLPLGEALMLEIAAQREMFLHDDVLPRLQPERHA